MGQKQGKLDEAELDFWAKETGMERKVLQDMYDSLASKKGISKSDFLTAYRQFFPKWVSF